MNDSLIQLLRIKLRIYNDILQSDNPNIDRKEVTHEMQKLAFRLQEELSK